MSFRLGRLAPLAVLALAAGCGQGGGSSPAKAAPASTNKPPTPPTNPPAPVTSGTPPPPITRPVGPVVLGATWTDVNGNGLVDAGDQIVVQFSREVVLTKASAADFMLPVASDRFGQAASVTSSSVPTNVIITLGQGAVITVKGTFSTTMVAQPGSPSGIDIAPAATSIKDLQGHVAVASRAVDIAGVGTPPPPPPPTALLLKGCDFADVNSSGAVDSGDTLTLHMSAPVVLGTGANQPKPSDFMLPVTNDSFGLASFVQAGKNPSDVVIVLGANATITLGGTFDPTKTTSGSFSGVGIGSTLTAAKLSSATGNLAVGASSGVSIVGTLGTPAGPKLSYVKFIDSNQNGKVDDGDVLVMGWSVSFINMGFGSSGPRVSDVLLPVTGDVIDPASTFDYGTGFNEVNLTIHGTTTVLTINGTFDPTVTTAGSASGFGFASSLPKGAITDGSNKDIQTGPATATDIAGTLVAATPPVIVSAFWVDRDLDGKASAGDTIVLEFNEPVFVNTTVAQASDFQLPVSGDSFGQGAKVTGGPNPAEVTITLGTNPSITVKGSFDKSKLSSGSASGVDVAMNPTAGAVRNTKMVDMVAATIAWDVQEPAGALDNPMSNDAVKDATATTADWNLGSSGKIAASARFDVGAGTTALAITTDTTIDTSQGAINGTPSPAFKGAGVFEFSTIDIARGVKVSVSGTNALVLKATGTATVNGTFLMDGMKGDDNLTTFGGFQGMGGAGGPGGSKGGNGAAGGGICIFPGQDGFGPLPGVGGGSEAHSGGGGGAGFASAGKNGTDGSVTGTGPGGLGGKGGAQAQPALLALDPLQGGSGGGGGGALQRPSPSTGTTSPSTSPGAGGGGGGGAFRLVAGGAISFGGTVSVTGGAGGSGGGLVGGGGAGGGAGGAILFQSNADVTLAPSATLLATGGKGGQGTAGGDGSDGVIRVEANGKFTQLPAAITGTARPAPTEGLVSPALGTGTSTLDLTISAAGTIDTDKGELNGTPVTGFMGKGVFACKNFTLAASATLLVVGNAPLTIQASGKVDVSGTINLDGANGQPAVGLNGGLGGHGRASGTNGGTGGSLTLSSGSTVASQVQPTDGTGAGAGTAAANGSSSAGGGGAAFGTDGSDGMGFGQNGKGGLVYGTPDLAVLAGGSGGGGGSANDSSGSFEGGGGAGAGGGAIEIDARGDVSVGGTITANGGNGALSTRGGNGGAGAGGAIAIRSLGRVSIAGALSALGGDGGKDGGPAGNGRIRLEDSVGSFTGGTVSPAITAGTFGTSVATSQWIRLKANGAGVMAARPLAILDKGTQSGGAFYAVEVEAANDLTGAPDPTTATGFQTDARALSGKEWARFRVTLARGAGGTGTASVDRVYVPWKQ